MWMIQVQLTLKIKQKNYIISGVIVHEDKVKDLKKAICQYKINNFTGEYIDAEIHTHDIYQGREEFTEITLETKYELLNKLYDIIKDMNIVNISVIINKQLLKKENIIEHVYEISWAFLIERFNKYIQEKDKYEGGIIKIDTSTNKQQLDILKIINELRKHGTRYDKCDRIMKEPIFVDSSAVEGIQVADAIAYCTFRRNTEKFKPYWNKIYGKFRKNNDMVESYGIKEYPKRE